MSVPAASLLIGHHSPPVLDGLALALARAFAQGEHDSVLTGRTPRECLGQARRSRPSVAVIDGDLVPGEASMLCTALDDLGVRVVMVLRDEPAEHLALLESGARGIALVDDGLEGLLLAVRTVLDGNAYVPPRLLGRLLRGLIDRRRAEDALTDRVARLSPREREVLALLGAGADHREIASMLFISPHTAKTHITRLLGKLDVHSRAEAAALAVAHGVLPTVAEEVSR